MFKKYPLILLFDCVLKRVNANNFTFSLRERIVYFMLCECYMSELKFKFNGS